VNYKNSLNGQQLYLVFTDKLTFWQPLLPFSQWCLE